MPLVQIYNLENFMNFVYEDSKNYQDEYEIHVINTDTKEYISHYPKLLENKNIKWHFINTNENKIITKIKKEDYTKSNKKAMIYFNAIGVDLQKINSFNPRLYFYNNNLTPFAKMKFK